jgi:predicted O-methyltransferase YrrM
MEISHLINETYYGVSDSSQHTLTLFALTIALKAKNILELGVRNGGTTQPFLNALHITKGMLTSVDIQEDVKLRANFDKHKNWSYIISDAIKFLQSVNKDVFYDIVFIDDWHDGKHLYSEICLIEKHITPSSLILIHDCMCYNTQPKYHYYLDNEGEFGNGGPYGAISRLDKNIWEYCTIPVNNGLTILRKLDKVVTF